MQGIVAYITYSIGNSGVNSCLVSVSGVWVKLLKDHHLLVACWGGEVGWRRVVWSCLSVRASGRTGLEGGLG